MGFIFGDSFDFYANGQPASELLLPGGLWNTANIGTSIASSAPTTRFNYGKYVEIVKSGITGGVLTSQQWPKGNTTATIYFNAAIMIPTPFGTGNDSYIYPLDITTAQFTIHFSSIDQTIYIRAGSAGAILATFPNAFFQNAWNHYQIKMIISPTVGEVHIRQNGVLADTWSVTGINTQASSGHSYINGIQFTNAASGFFVDDLLIIDDSGTALNTWVGDVRSYMISPAAPGSNTQFTSQSQSAGINATGVTQAHAVGETWLGEPFTSTYGGVISTVQLKLIAGFTGNMAAAIYDNNTKLQIGSQATPVNNPAIGYVNFTFPTPVPITAGGSYCIAVQSDTAMSLDGGSNATAIKKTGTYGTWPSMVSGTTTGQTRPYALATIVPPNWFNVSQQVQDGDTTMNYSNVVGATDSYAVNGLPVVPSSIVVMQIRELSRMSDTGARSTQTYLKSGTTVVLGTAGVLSTTYQYMPFQQYALDPNTGARWTYAGINAIELGIKVAA
jgi:hypothetical protein